MRIGNLVMFKKKIDGETKTFGALTLEPGSDVTIDEIKTVLDGVKKASREIGAPEIIELLSTSHIEPLTKNIPFFSFPAVIFYDRENKTFKGDLFQLAAENIFSGYGRFFPSLFIGGIVKGSDFFDRKKEIKTITDLLRNGKNINLRAPRRFGKTSVMSYLAENPEKISADMQPIYIDLEKIDNPAKFAATFCVHIRRYIDISKSLPCLCERSEAELIDEIKKLTLDWEDSWERNMQKIFESAEKSGKIFLYLLDEITLMLDHFKKGKYDIAGFLDWFEKVRAQLKRTRFLFGASSSIESYLKSRNLRGYFDDCETVPLAFFSEDISRLFIESLLYGMGIYPSQNIIKAILNLSAPTVPYFTQILVGQIAAFHRRKGRAPGEDELKRIYEDELTGPDCRRIFDQYVNRLDCHRENRDAVLGLLSELAQNNDGVSDTYAKTYLQKQKIGSEEIEKILSYLEFDFYIESEQNQIRFANPILRDYWRKYR